jgi:Major Vault Protein Repeat domain/Shoulder domain
VTIYGLFLSIYRVVFGPDLVMLGPDEQFTQLSLSGGKPKKTNQIRSLCLLLGPDFCTDVIVVETADHARLQLQLSYNWLAFLIFFTLLSERHSYNEVIDDILHWCHWTILFVVTD